MWSNGVDAGGRAGRGVPWRGDVYRVAIRKLRVDGFGVGRAPSDGGEGGDVSPRDNRHADEDEGVMIVAERGHVRVFREFTPLRPGPR